MPHSPRKATYARAIGGPSEMAKTSNTRRLNSPRTTTDKAPTSPESGPRVTYPSDSSPSTSTGEGETSSTTRPQLDDSTAFIQADPLAKLSAFATFPSGEQVGSSGFSSDRDKKTAMTKTILERYAYNYFAIYSGRVTFDGPPQSRSSDAGLKQHQLVLTSNSFSERFSVVCAGNDSVLAADFAVVLPVGGSTAEHRLSKETLNHLAYCNCKGSVMGDKSSSVQINLCGSI